MLLLHILHAARNATRFIYEAIRGTAESNHNYNYPTAFVRCIIALMPPAVIGIHLTFYLHEITRNLLTPWEACRRADRRCKH